MENIYRVTQVKLNQLVKEMSTRSLNYQQSVFKRYDSDKHCQSLYVKMAAKINWHRYGTKLRHCRPMYRPTLVTDTCTPDRAPAALAVASTRVQLWRRRGRHQAEVIISLDDNVGAIESVVSTCEVCAKPAELSFHENSRENDDSYG